MMTLEIISAVSRSELIVAVNAFLQKGPILLAYEPKIFFNQYRKKWYCIIWYQ